ncbi:MAG: hypothetical protein LUO79_01760 [Methanomassiliicoccales archaeon]|nr:hypothetical protein [Methanomassiliicoccales archaeon]
MSYVDRSMTDIEVRSLAELQWAVQVKCINALLAEIKVGEKGELIIVNVPDRNLGPSEFDKLIEGLEVAGTIAKENRESSRKTRAEFPARRAASRPSGKVKLQRKRNLYELKLLETGEIVNVVVPDMLFTPSELDRFVDELKTIGTRMAKLRGGHARRSK